MTARQIAFYSVVLVVLGIGWGATQPLTKIAVSTGLGQFGLVFWQMVIGGLIMGAICAMRRLPVPITPGAMRLYFIIALVGTVVPNSMSYSAAVHLPAGIMSLLISTVPMFAFVIALALGTDQFAWRRLAGLMLGLAGVLIIVAPGADLGMNFPVIWAAIYLLVALCYGFEGNYVARWGTRGLGPFQVMAGASLVGATLSLPLMVFSGQTFVLSLPLDLPQTALVLSSVVHALVYATYIWLVGRAGPVFATQVSYPVTLSGLIWAGIILGETYQGALWLALALMLAGLYLVQPRRKEPLAAGGAIGEGGA